MPLRQSFFLLIFSGMFSFSLTLRSETERNTEATSSIPVKAMDYGDAFIYGIVEGVTEFLPISSTGHLVLTSEVIGSDKWDLSQQEALHAYLIVIQGGAILAVAIIYWSRIWSMFIGIFGVNPGGRKLLINILIAFIPAPILGLLLDSIIEEFLFGLLPIAIALLLGAFLMLWAEKRKQKVINLNTDRNKNLESLEMKDSLTIGLLQCVAMCPGTSRSMMTIVGGYLVGLERKYAAEFSFLLGLVTLTAAAGYKTITKWETMSSHLTIGPVLMGCLVAGVSAAFSVVWLVGYLSRNGLGVFVIYRIILSIAIFAFYFYGK